MIDPTVSGPLSLVAEFSVLKEHGVDKIYHLTETPFETECKSLLFITRPSILHMKWIAQHIKAHKLNHHLFFVPRRTLICERILEEEGVYADVSIGEFYLDLIPLEEDVISLEMPKSFHELFIVA